MPTLSEMLDVVVEAKMRGREVDNASTYADAIRRNLIHDGEEAIQAEYDRAMTPPADRRTDTRRGGERRGATAQAADYGLTMIDHAVSLAASMANRAGNPFNEAAILSVLMDEFPEAVARDALELVKAKRYAWPMPRAYGNTPLVERPA